MTTTTRVLTLNEIGNGSASSWPPTLTWSGPHGPETLSDCGTWSGSLSEMSDAGSGNGTGCWMIASGGYCVPPDRLHCHRRYADPPPDGSCVRSTQCRPTSQWPSSCPTTKQTQRHWTRGRRKGILVLVSSDSLMVNSPLVPPLLVGIRIGDLSSLAHEIFQVL